FFCAMLPASARAASQAHPPNAQSRPNIIFILLDDLRWDEVDYPFVKVPNIHRIANEGVTFRNAFITTPLCSPSRASFLTGQYAHTHGITDNTDHSPRSYELVTFPRLLHDAGYETAFIGKWHMGVDDSARPGIDYWVGMKGQGHYLDPELNVNGERRKYPGYFTDILNKFAVDFLKQPHAKPFLLYIAHKAVHPELTQYADGSVSDLGGGQFLPAERHKTLYAEDAIPHRASYGKAPQGKPALLRQIGDLPPLGPSTVTDDETIRNRLRMLASMDEGLGEMLAVLEAQKQLDNTLIIFTSDEGYFYGEHGLSAERRLAYEESIRIPLLMRYPKLIKAGSVLDQFALSIDIAPTVLAIGGAPAATDMHGRSLLPLLKGQRIAWRDSVLVEYFSDKVFPRVVNMGYQAVRTQRWKYIHYVDLEGMDELYDLRTDPFEMSNVIAAPQAQTSLEDLKAELQKLLRNSP
ncbi:MAG TPA: sulfatase, partial [Steroidobacteraceae bacterium]|nr:sulfatase [Steroidobacteraceae bacterium]